jgi:hypothetical protein
VRRKLGDDGGCFDAALEAVRRWGGVLEHPEATHAFGAFGLNRPPRVGLWIAADDCGWACCVEQGHYGHRARKATWLYAVTPRPAPLIWGPSEGIRLDAGFHSAEERRRLSGTVRRARISARECAATPPAFRDVLLEIARSAA